MDVTEVLLPGVGLRYEFTNHQGDRLGVVARRTGDFEVVVYKAEDPDAARTVLRLNAEEADTVAEILGAPRIAERFADLTKEVPGLLSGQVEVRATARMTVNRWAAPGRGPGPERRSSPLSAATT